MKRLIISTHGEKSFKAPAKMFGQLKGEKKVLLEIIEKPSDANDTEKEYKDAFGNSITFSFKEMTLKEYRSEKKKALIGMVHILQSPMTNLMSNLKNTKR